jgi:hypothetical protein
LVKNGPLASKKLSLKPKKLFFISIFVIDITIGYGFLFERGGGR